MTIFSSIKNKGVLLTALILILTLYFCLPAIAAIYYVNYASGTPTASGTSTGTAWKYCPGDSRFAAACTGNCATTWTAAGSRLNAGDRVIFKGGVVYSLTSGTFHTYWSGSGDADANRVIYDGDSGTYASRWGSGTTKAIIDGGNSNDTLILMGAANYVTLNNLELRNVTSSLIDASSWSSAYVNISNCSFHDAGSNANPNSPTGSAISSYGSHWKVTYNSFQDTYGAAITSFVSDDGTNGNYNEFAFNTFTDKMAWSITVMGNHSSIHDNVFADCGKFYFPYAPHVNVIFSFINSVTKTITDFKIYNNLIYYTGANSGGQTAAIQFVVDGSALHSTWDNLYIYNNVIVNTVSTNAAIMFSSAGGYFTNLYIYNNSIWNSTAGIALYGGSTGGYHSFTNAYIKGNSIYSPSGGTLIVVPSDNFTNINIDYNNYYSSASTPLMTGTHTTNYSYNMTSWRGLGYDINGKGTTSDPLYTAASTTQHDLTVPSNSPLVNAFPTASAPTSLFTYDRNNTSRPQGSAWDIGAYEY